MLGLKLLEIINKLSFAFSFLSYFFYYRLSSLKYTIMYIITIVIIALGVYLKKKKRIYALAIFLIIPILILFQWDLFSIVSIAAFTAVYLYLDKGINYINFSFSNFKYKNIIYLIIILFSLITKTSYMINKISVLFMMVYFISSIALFRSLRYLKTNTNIQEISMQNLKYSIGIILLSILLSVEKFWKLLIRGIKIVYNFLLDIIINFFTWLFLLFEDLLEDFANYLDNLMGNQQKPIEIEPMPKFPDSENYTELENEKLSLILKIVLKWFLAIILIFLAVYIIWKLSKRYQNRVIIKEGYIEEKEFIITKNKKKAKKRRFFKPKDKKELIRYYYSKFLDKCKKQKILLAKYNTTLEINQEAKKKFKSIPLEKIREIYIKVRYGNITPDKITLKEFKENYKKLN